MDGAILVKQYLNLTDIGMLEQVSYLEQESKQAGRPGTSL